MKADNFPQWLSQELKKHDWSIRELGRRSGVSHSLVAKVMKGEAEASWDFCAGIAPALGYSPVEILLIADKLRRVLSLRRS